VQKKMSIHGVHDNSGPECKDQGVALARSAYPYGCALGLLSADGEESEGGGKGEEDEGPGTRNRKNVILGRGPPLARVGRPYQQDHQTRRGGQSGSW